MLSWNSQEAHTVTVGVTGHNGVNVLIWDEIQEREGRDSVSAIVVMGRGLKWGRERVEQCRKMVSSSFTSSL